MKFAKLRIPAITCFFLWGCAAGAVFPATTAFSVHILTTKGSTNHCPRTPDTALDFNCLYRAVEGTCPALHASFRMGKHNRTLPRIENRVGTDLRTSLAVDTSIGIIMKCGFRIRVKHQITPSSLLTPSMIPARIPKPAITAIPGTYRKISFLTPVREVKVVHPVKLRAIYAVTAGIIKSAVAAASKFAQNGIAGTVAKETANGKATSPPRISPFVEKSCVGINGRSAGKITVPAITADITASAATGPARNQRSAAAANIGRAAWTNSTGVRTILSLNGNCTRRISGVAVCVVKY
jgi:hypothetical protein